MKKTSKACFVLAIITLSISVIVITLSFMLNTIQYRQSFGFYSIQYTSVGVQSGLKTLVLGCTLMISGLLLFILSIMLKCITPCAKPVSKATPKAEVKPEPKVEVKAEPEPEPKVEEVSAPVENTEAK